MTSTLIRTNSAANSAKRASRPSAQRYSMATVRFSIQPSSCSRCTKASIEAIANDALFAPRNPIVGNFAACCARAASGHATPKAATPSMKVRRRIAAPEAQGLCHGRTQLQQGFATDEMGFRVRLHGSNPEPLMSALDQKQTLAFVRVISALPPIADITESDWDVRFVPKADILRRGKTAAIRSPR